MTLIRDLYAKTIIGPVSLRSEEPLNNARSLLNRLQRLLPKIEDYFPDRGQTIRRRVLEVGADTDDDSTTLDVDESTSDSLLMAAQSAPAQMQSELYEQAARKALAEGKYDRALEIAGDHLDKAGRQAITEAIELRRMAVNPTPEQMERLRRKLEALPTSARVQALVEMAAVAEKENRKLALTFLDDAVKIVSNKASSYSDFEDQLKVVEALARLDLKRSLAVLELGIAQLNEILAASAVVNGF